MFGRRMERRLRNIGFDGARIRHHLVSPMTEVDISRSESAGSVAMIWTGASDFPCAAVCPFCACEHGGVRPAGRPRSCDCLLGAYLCTPNHDRADMPNWTIACRSLRHLCPAETWTLTPRVQAPCATTLPYTYVGAKSCSHKRIASVNILRTNCSEDS